MAEFTIAGDAYQTMRMKPKTQMRVLRRIARIAPALKGVTGLTDQFRSGERPSIEQVAELLAPVVTAFADMSDDDVEFIMDTALEHTRHRPGSGPAAAGGRWYKVRENGTVMNQANEELNRSLVITYYVLEENFQLLFKAATGGDVPSLDEMPYEPA